MYLLIQVGAMITFTFLLFNPFELAQGDLSGMAEVHVAFTSFSTPCPRCCPFQSRVGWTTDEVCNPEDEKNSVWGSIFCSGLETASSVV